ncbi:MAG: flagellar basal body L-ring protein FlgH [Bacilli bacterium]
MTAWPLTFAGAALVATAALQANAADLAARREFASLTADRTAAHVGDTLTVLVYEAAFASNTAEAQTRKAAQMGGRLARPSDDDVAEVSLTGRYNGSGESTRADKLVAQISVVVTDVLPNGDLAVAGEQLRQVNGQDTRIRVQGRVRRADISSANAVLSTRLADAVIQYDGKGHVTQAARPGLVTRLLQGLGLF